VHLLLGGMRRADAEGLLVLLRRVLLRVLWVRALYRPADLPGYEAGQHVAPVIARRASLRRSAPIRRKAQRWKPKAKTGRRQPKGFVAYRKGAKSGHELWRKLIYALEPSGICPICRARKHTDAMHIFGKGTYPQVRLDIENGVPGCRPCHTRFDSDHEFKREFATRYLGAERYELLRLRALTRGKTDMGLALMYLRAKSAEAK